MDQHSSGSSIGRRRTRAEFETGQAPRALFLPPLPPADAFRHNSNEEEDRSPPGWKQELRFTPPANRQHALRATAGELRLEEERRRAVAEGGPRRGTRWAPELERTLHFERTAAAREFVNPSVHPWDAPMSDEAASYEQVCDVLEGVRQRVFEGKDPAFFFKQAVGDGPNRDALLGQCFEYLTAISATLAQNPMGQCVLSARVAWECSDRNRTACQRMLVALQALLGLAS